jgi:hypothetical protein
VRIRSLSVGHERAVREYLSNGLLGTEDVWLA